MDKKLRPTTVQNRTGGQKSTQTNKNPKQKGEKKNYTGGQKPTPTVDNHHRETKHIHTYTNGGGSICPVFPPVEVAPKLECPLLL